MCSAQALQTGIIIITIIINYIYVMFIYKMNVYRKRRGVAPGEILVEWNDVCR